jgi:lysophospholipase L1-like esterase
MISKGKRILKTLLWNFSIFIFLLIILEIFLFFKGYECGMVQNNSRFKRVDQLIMLDGYITDEDGITKVNSNARKYNKNYILKGKEINNAKYFKINNLDYGTHILGRDYLALKQQKLNNEFSSFISTIKLKNNQTEVEQAYLDYSNSPINSDGFRSIEFKNFDTDKTKVLLLGDSFTWGHNAENKTDSFANILSSKGYIVFNTGITATDLPQYHAILKKYISIIQPDIVISNIYLGNDIQQFDRKPNKDIPVFFPTNAGYIMSCPSGISISTADSAYQNIIEINSIQQNSRINRIMSSSRITTQVWGILSDFRFKHIDFTNQPAKEYWNKVEKINEKYGYSMNRIYLEKIDSIAAENNAISIHSIIAKNDNIHISTDSITTLLDGYKNFHTHYNITDSDYAKDGHYNEAGHQKYAESLDSIIIVNK